MSTPVTHGNLPYIIGASQQALFERIASVQQSLRTALPDPSDPHTHFLTHFAITTCGMETRFLCAIRERNYREAILAKKAWMECMMEQQDMITESDRDGAGFDENMAAQVMATSDKGDSTHHDIGSGVAMGFATAMQQRNEEFEARLRACRLQAQVPRYRLPRVAQPPDAVVILLDPQRPLR